MASILDDIFPPGVDRRGTVFLAILEEIIMYGPRTRDDLRRVSAAAGDETGGSIDKLLHLGALERCGDCMPDGLIDIGARIRTEILGAGKTRH